MTRSKKEAPAPKSPIKKVVVGTDKKKEPGLLKQVAANAAGVAVGSAVGHAVGHKLANGSGGGEKKTEAALPCDFEWEQFIRCTKETKEPNKCPVEMNAFKECQKKNRL